MISIYLFELTIYISLSFFLSFIFKLNDKKKISNNSNLNVFLIGGFLFSLVFIRYFDIKDIYLIFFILSFMVLGYLDDKFDIKVIIRFIFAFIIFYFFIINNHNYLIKLYFLPDNYIFNIIISSIIFLGFLHMSNMTDGRNGLLSTNYIIVYLFIFLFLENEPISKFEIIFLISLIIFTIINLFNISFLGNSGVMVLASISYILFTSLYASHVINTIDILCLFSFQILDGLRVSFLRIKNNKNLFKKDLLHVHYNFENWLKGYFVYFVFVILNLVFLYFFRNFSSGYFCLIFSTMCYLLVLLISKQKNT